MPAVPDAAADVPDAAAETSSEADDDNETLGAVGGGSTAYCVATGAAGATRPAAGAISARHATTRAIFLNLRGTS